MAKITPPSRLVTFLGLNSIPRLSQGDEGKVLVASVDHPQKVVRFASDQAPFVREREWHPTQRLRDLPGGGVELTFRGGGRFEITRWILGWGAAAEVVRPASLRREVAAALARAGRALCTVEDTTRWEIRGADMSIDRQALKDIFDTAVAAIVSEDRFLRNHCPRACGLNHGVGWVREPVLMHVIFRAVMERHRNYSVGMELPYPSDRNCQADLVLFRDNIRDDSWVACFEGKWIESDPKVASAIKDLERMRGKLGADVGKFLLAFWARDSRYPAKLAQPDRWLGQLDAVPGVERLFNDNFPTLWSHRDGERVSLVEVEAGLTLFEVK